MRHARTKALYGYWDRLRGRRDAPERAELDPGAMRDHLADLFILDVEDRAAITYRLAGTRVCDAFGHELRGRDFLEPWTLEDRAALSTLIWSVVDEGAGAVCGWKGRTTRGDRLAFETLLLPLRLDGSRSRRVLGSSVASDSQGGAGASRIAAAELTAVRMIWADGPPAFSRKETAVLPMVPPPVRVRHLAVIEGGRR